MLYNPVLYRRVQSNEIFHGLHWSITVYHGNACVGYNYVMSLLCNAFGGNAIIYFSGLSNMDQRLLKYYSCTCVM